MTKRKQKSPTKLIRRSICLLPDEWAYIKQESERLSVSMNSVARTMLLSGMRCAKHTEPSA